MKRCITLAGLAALCAPAHLAAQSPSSGGPGSLPPPVVHETALELENGSSMRYALALPADFEDSPDVPRPLVLALHPGGRDVYYGSWFLQSIVEPALRDWDAVMVAPDVPDRSWSTERSERALLELVERVMAEHTIDRSKVLVTGFSMGGRGSWHMAWRHPDIFTAAIVMAGSPQGVDLDAILDTPLYLIHSPNDEVVPFGPAEAAYERLAALGHRVRFKSLPGASHYAMGDYVPALGEAGTWIRAQWGEKSDPEHSIDPRRR